MNLLINEPPLQVIPSLAVEIGLNEAIILQQTHYWLRISENVRDGFKWIYKKYEEWQREFPFWSDKTIRRTITNLEKRELLISTEEYNKFKADRTKWYRINYEKLALVKTTSPTGQNDQSHWSECPPLGLVKTTNPITREYTENTTENINCRKQAFDEDSPVTKIVNFFVDEIRKNRPDFKGYSKSWFTDTDRILRLDNRDPKEVCRIIRFAQADDFWKANILSPKKLRQHYDALAIKLQQTNQKANGQKAGAAPVAYKPVELDLSAGED